MFLKLLSVDLTILSQGSLLLTQINLNLGMDK